MAKSYYSSAMKKALAIHYLFLLLVGMTSAQLSPVYYATSCPNASNIIRREVFAAVAKESRMGASLLRLHFHDCFVNGCDASVLLDDTANFTGEKTAFPNNNSLRGFEVIDSIKDQLENICPGVVSCADILTLAGLYGVLALTDHPIKIVPRSCFYFSKQYIPRKLEHIELGGPNWPVALGRRDSTTASLTGANTEIPGPFLNVSDLIASFGRKGFTPREMVALSGAHTIGQASCVVFRDRIYNESNINPLYAAILKISCPIRGSDNNLSPLDATTSTLFDNAYYLNLMSQRGLLHSDQALYSGFGGSTDLIVMDYALNSIYFATDFANAMIKMDNLSPLTGASGQVRLNCRKVN